MKKRKDIITCPNCGAEYLAGELFIPNWFLGRPLAVERDKTNHKIINSTGIPMTLDEEYICDFCNKLFFIHANIEFNTKIDNRLDSGIYVSDLHKFKN